MKLTVYRPEKVDFQPIEAELIKKPGKGFGLSVIAKKDGKGVYISEIVSIASILLPLSHRYFDKWFSL